MAMRNILAVLILIGGAAASFYCYSQLSQLLPMSDRDMVSKAEATILQVDRETMRMNAGLHEASVLFTFHPAQVVGKEYEGGGRSIYRGDKPPEEGMTLPVVYYTNRPGMVMLQEEYNALPQRLLTLRLRMVGFALIAIFAPFCVMKHRQ